MHDNAASGREGRYQLILDALPDFVYVVDRSGRIVLINQALLNALPSIGVEGTPLGRLWQEAFPFLPAAVQEELDRVFETGQPLTTTRELRLQDRDVAVQSVRVPILGEGGDVIEVASLLRDVEPQRRAEEALRRERDLVRAIFESAPFAITVTDLEARVIDGNQRAWQEGRHPSKEAFLGRNGLEFVVPAERARALEAMVRTFHDGVVRGVRYAMRRADGSEHPGELSAAVIRSSQGEPVGYVSFSEDITERTLLEERLRQAHQLESLGRFAGGVAHEFNDLLMAIQGYAGFAREALEPEHPAAQDLAELQQAAVQAEDLVRQLLAFGRQAPSEPVRLLPNERLTLFSRTIRQLVGPEVVAEFALQPDLWPIMVDPASFEKALIHLVVNARDRMPEGGMLVVRTENVPMAAGAPDLPPGPPPGDFVCISVADTGPAMAEAVRERLFEPFATALPLAPGNALGLPVVHGLVGQAGGFVGVRSEEGGRTELRLYYPRDVARAARPDSGEAAALDGHETVLLVEDQALVRATAARTLRRHGYQVLEAGSAEEAWRLLEEDSLTVNLLLTDVVLPRQSGLELASRVRATRPTLPVVIMSGFAQERLLDDATRPLIADFIEKPFTAGQLLKRIRRVLDL